MKKPYMTREMLGRFMTIECKLNDILNVFENMKSRITSLEESAARLNWRLDRHDELARQCDQLSQAVAEIQNRLSGADE